MLLLLPTTGKTEVEWTSIEAKNLRDFLTSDTGKKLLTLCLDQTPSLLDGADVNQTLVSSGARKGHDTLLEYIVGLTAEQPQKLPTSEPYPSLDDDSKWESEPDSEKPTQP